MEVGNRTIHMPQGLSGGREGEEGGARGAGMCIQAENLIDIVPPYES